MTTATQQLYRTATGGRRHILSCPHLIGKDVFEAAEDDGEICSMCDRELRGEGRRYFTSLADALPEFGAARSNWPEITRLLEDVEHDVVWMVNSGSYIALGLGGRAVAWTGKTCVYPPGAYVELPDYRASGGGGAPVRDTWGETCERHFVKRSRNGNCERCDD